MPPVAAARTLRYIGKTARDASMRPLQTCRKYHIITEYGGNKIHHAVGAVIDRPRSHPGNATYRVNRTGEQCSPLQPNR